MKKRECSDEAIGVAVGVGGVEKACGVVIVEEGYELILRGGIVVRRERVVVIFDLLGVARGVAEDTLSREEQRVIEQRIQFVSTAALCAGVAAALGVRAVEDFAEHKEVGFAIRRSEGVNARTPILPESHLAVLHGIHAKAIEAHCLDPVIENRCHVGADVCRLGAEIIQPAECAKFSLLSAVVILDVSVVVENVGEVWLRSVGLKRRGVLIACASVTERVARRIIKRVIIDRVLDERSAVIHNNILNDEQPSRVRGVDHALKIRERAPVRINLVKVFPSIAVILAAAVQDDG